MINNSSKPGAERRQHGMRRSGTSVGGSGHGFENPEEGQGHVYRSRLGNENDDAQALGSPMATGKPGCVRQSRRPHRDQSRHRNAAAVHVWRVRRDWARLGSQADFDRVREHESGSCHVRGNALATTHAMLTRCNAR